MNISLRHIRTLNAIVTHGSFAAAARELGVVPSALTETINQFEREIGEPLFDRSRRPPLPTPTARAFLQETGPHLDGLERALSRLHSGKVAAHQSLRIGSAPSAISDYVAPAIASLRKVHAHLHVRVVDDIADGLARRVVEGALDLAVAGRVQHSADLRQSELMRDPFGLACAASHPLAAAASVRLSDIDPQEVISLDPGTGTQQLLAQSRHIPTALSLGAIEAGSTIAQLCMIRAGLGVGLLPRNALMLFGDPSLRFITVTDLNLWRDLYLLVPAQRRPTRIARDFIDHLREIVTAA